MSSIEQSAQDVRKELVEKACEFLFERFWTHPHYSLICTEWDGGVDEFIDMFVKYMEE